MERYSTSSLLILAGMTLFWAFTIRFNLIEEFSANLIFIDLGPLVLLGFLAGLAIGFIPAVREQRSGN